MADWFGDAHAGHEKYIAESCIEAETPEMKMLGALLSRGMMDLRDPDQRQDALSWFRGRSNSEVFGSFEFVCLHLNICAKRWRKMALDVYTGKRRLHPTGRTRNSDLKWRAA